MVFIPAEKICVSMDTTTELPASAVTDDWTEKKAVTVT
jgi:hypothetical protein